MRHPGTAPAHIEFSVAEKIRGGKTGGYTLAVSMELYMYEDTSQYMQELLEQDTDEEGQENTENTEEDQNPANQ